MEGMGLDIFDAMVTAEDDMDTHASQLLAAAIKLARPPRKCVAFTGSPEVVTAAHNCTMKAVGVVGSYKHYDLNHADLTCGSMSELSLINVRRLFALDGEFHISVSLSLSFLPSLLTASFLPPAQFNLLRRVLHGPQDPARGRLRELLGADEDRDL